jgi:hypothetical protein
MIESDAEYWMRRALARDEQVKRVAALLRECDATLAMWSDVAPAVSLRKDIAAVLVDFPLEQSHSAAHEQGAPASDGG